MKERIKKIQKAFYARGAHMLLVSDPKNIFYLSGFMPSDGDREALLLVTLRNATLFVSPLCVDVARRHTTLSCVSAAKGPFGNVAGKLQTNKKVLFDDRDLRVRELAFLRKNTKAQWREDRGLVKDARRIKDRREIQKIKKACAITDKVFKKTVQYLRRADYTKITEQDLAEKMLQWGRDVGAGASLKWAFDPIVASGVHSAVPHHVPTKRKLKKNVPLLLDFGFLEDGYNSDMSRTIFLGTPSKKFTDMYNFVLHVNQQCTQKVAAGVSGAELYDYAINLFGNEVSKYFTHALGHGLGLDPHEPPVIAPRGKEPLQMGEVITIEPGLYFDGQWGIRIEDDILVTRGEGKILTRSERDLIVIK